MPLPPDSLAVLRSYVGTGPTDDELEARYLRLGSYDQVVIETLRVRYQELLEYPDSLTVPGLSITFGQLRADTKKYLDSFLASGTTGLDPEPYSTIGFVHVSRKDYR